jgi:hypothetical protein
MGWYGLDSSGSGQGTVEEYCKHYNEPLGSSPESGVDAVEDRKISFPAGTETIILQYSDI